MKYQYYFSPLLFLVSCAQNTSGKQKGGETPVSIDKVVVEVNPNSKGKEATDLDDCRGHYDEVRGYHYHVDKAGANNFINCLSGAYAE